MDIKRGLAGFVIASAAKKIQGCSHRFPASRVVTIAIRPSYRGGMRGENINFWKNEKDLFLADELDLRDHIDRPSQIGFSARPYPRSRKARPSRNLVRQMHRPKG
jgi:hypothetical protein